MGTPYLYHGCSSWPYGDMELSHHQSFTEVDTPICVGRCDPSIVPVSSGMFWGKSVFFSRDNVPLFIYI